MQTGDVVEIRYGYTAHPTDPNHYDVVAETGLWLQRLPDGREEVLTTDGKIVRCSYTRLAVRCQRDSLCYEDTRRQFFPHLDPALDSELLVAVEPHERAA